MTPKIARYLATERPMTPCLVVDLDVVADSYQTLQAALPLAKIYYAVKANPARPLLDVLIRLGSNFDAASGAEVDACLAAGASPERISFGNTVKHRRDIARAYQGGVRMFAFDSADELTKLADEAPGSQVYCRILTANDDARWPLSRKFGCELDMAKALLLRAADLGLDPIGISFHVGSQQVNAEAWEVAIGRAALVFTDLRDRGLELRLLNLGGGFPARYRGDDLPPLDHYASTIMAAMRRRFGNALPDMVIEPGRTVAGAAGVIQSEVLLVSRKSDEDRVRWVYLDVGMFGGLAETIGEAIRYPIATPHDGGPEGPVAIAGPTCDGADILYENCGYTLPLALKTGDRVELLTAGAYTSVYASHGFNGFAPMAEHYL